jgi:hypothetical protein
MRIAVALLGLALVLGPRSARAEWESSAVPPPSRASFLQYGVAFTSEFATGSFFCHPQSECALGSGAGLVGRVGMRSAGPWYLGGAYEISKQDPAKLYRLAILHQIRFEARYYIETGREGVPYLTFGGGIAGYGNEFISIDTWGGCAFGGVGIETQIANGPTLGAALVYRPIYLQAWTVDQQLREAGLAHFIGLDLAVEGRDKL